MIEVRDMRPADWPDVARIYAEGLDEGTFEDTVPSWEDWDAGRLPAPRLVAGRNGEIVGWAALGPVSSRECYRGVTENSVYVAREARGAGIGHALLDELIRRADAAGIWTIEARVLAGNDASVALHTACGFRVVGTRERLARKHGLWRDVIVLERRSPNVL